MHISTWFWGDQLARFDRCHTGLHERVRGKGCERKSLDGKCWPRGRIERGSEKGKERRDSKEGRK